MSYFAQIAIGRIPKDSGPWQTYQVQTLNLEPTIAKPFDRGTTPPAAHIGELLCLLRKDRKLTQAELSRGIYTQGHYNKIEKGLTEAGALQKEWLFQRLGRYPYYDTAV